MSWLKIELHICIEVTGHLLEHLLGCKGVGVALCIQTSVVLLHVIGLRIFLVLSLGINTLIHFRRSAGRLHSFVVAHLLGALLDGLVCLVGKLLDTLLVTP